MSLSRRALFPAAVGGALAAPDIVQAATQGMTNVPRAVLPPSAYYGLGDVQGEQAEKAAFHRQHLIDRRAKLERWMRGDFGEDGDTEPHFNRTQHDAAAHELQGLRSVSMAHKCRMANDLAVRRAREQRMRDAGFELQHIIKQLMGLS